MRHVLSFGLGVAVATAVSVLGYSPLAHHYFRLGQSDGQILAKLAFVQTVKTLGADYRRADGYNLVLEVKDVTVVQVERNGVKTLSLHNPNAN